MDLGAYAGQSVSLTFACDQNYNAGDPFAVRLTKGASVWELIPRSAPITQAAPQGCDSYGTVTTTVPAGALQDGVTLRFEQLNDGGERVRIDNIAVVPTTPGVQLASGNPTTPSVWTTIAPTPIVLTQNQTTTLTIPVRLRPDLAVGTDRIANASLTVSNEQTLASVATVDVSVLTPSIAIDNGRADHHPLRRHGHLHLHRDQHRQHRVAERDRHRPPVVRRHHPPERRRRQPGMARPRRDLGLHLLNFPSPRQPQWVPSRSPDTGTATGEDSRGGVAGTVSDSDYVSVDVSPPR